MKPYDEMTSANSPWLGEIPAHWELSRFRYEAVINGGQVDPREEPWCGMTLIAPNHIDSNTGRIIGIETAESQGADSGKYLVEQGQLVYSKIRPVLNKAAIAETQALCSADMYAMSFFDRVEPRFALYYFLARPFHTFVTIISMRVKMPKVNREELADAPWLVPPLDEQRAIATYLDRETARIDTLIEEQQRLITMLRERRSVVLTQAATRGLDGAALADSGNVYLGAVPAHWTISRFSREMDVNGGQVDPRDDPWADMVLVAPNHIESGTGRIVGRETAREQGADSGKYLANAGQILYSKIRPALNKVAVATEDCLTSADMYAMSSRRGDDHRYLMYFMLARPFHAFATLASLRVKMPKVNRDELGEAPFLRPPVEEQRKIVAYLDEQTAKIDALIAESERFVELSRERRSALITAAVTGQIDVRERV
ncbi:restriction endonuclease subunit S [Amycolatopsis sp. NPDC089917]|uniref:restriction endonuclease subunit S n=1 Tax=Amycolatopsis sp. NPDC089917 TaxID=3155187 RepID=UPI00342D411F